MGVVIMKRVRKNGLYVLIRSSHTLGVTASVSSDKTKLWHMREFHKQGLFGGDPISSLEFCKKMYVWESYHIEVQHRETRNQTHFGLCSFKSLGTITRWSWIFHNLYRLFLKKGVGLCAEI